MNKQTDLTMLDNIRQRQRRHAMMKWLLMFGKEWVKFEADGVLQEFPFRMLYADEGLLERYAEKKEVKYRITDKGVALIGDKA